MLAEAVLASQNVDRAVPIRRLGCNQCRTLPRSVPELLGLRTESVPRTSEDAQTFASAAA